MADLEEEFKAVQQEFDLTLSETCVRRKFGVSTVCWCISTTFRKNLPLLALDPIR